MAFKFSISETTGFKINHLITVIVLICGAHFYPLEGYWDFVNALPRGVEKWILSTFVCFIIYYTICVILLACYWLFKFLFGEIMFTKYSDGLNARAVGVTAKVLIGSYLIPILYQLFPGEHPYYVLILEAIVIGLLAFAPVRIRVIHFSQSQTTNSNQSESNEKN